MKTVSDYVKREYKAIFSEHGLVYRGFYLFDYAGMKLSIQTEADYLDVDINGERLVNYQIEFMSNLNKNRIRFPFSKELFTWIEEDFIKQIKEYETNATSSNHVG